MSILGLHMPDLGISERLNQLVTGRTPTTGHDNLFYNNISAANGLSNQKGVDNPVGPYNSPGYQPINNQNVNYNDIKNSGSAQGNINSQNQKNAINAITGNWDDTSGSIKDTGKALDEFGNSISSGLGAARDAYVGAAQNTLNKNNAAIAGNKQLIAKNQTKDLTNLSDQLRTSIMGANRKLGLMGSGNSSATGAASEALQRSAGKNRQTTLTQYGDQTSKENQNASVAAETYATQRKQAYDWEERNRQQLMDEYDQEKSILDNLKNKVPDWKKKDIDALSNNNLNKLVSGLQGIYSSAKAYRDTLSNAVTGMYGNADALNSSAVTITPPSELNTPDFTDQLNIPTDPSQTDNNATDFNNPNVTGKKRIGYDILGNPYYVDETGNPVTA